MNICKQSQQLLVLTDKPRQREHHLTLTWAIKQESTPKTTTGQPWNCTTKLMIVQTITLGSQCAITSQTYSIHLLKSHTHSWMFCSESNRTIQVSFKPFFKPSCQRVHTIYVCISKFVGKSTSLNTGVWCQLLFCTDTVVSQILKKRP